MPKHYEGHEFEALKLRYEDQVELLRTLTQLDFRIFVSFFTLQLVLGGWLASQPASTPNVQWGLVVINAVLAALSIKLLYNQHRRRQEVAATIANINNALGFAEPGVYLESKPLNPPYERRYWFKWYVVGVAVSSLGLVLVLFRH